MQWVQSDLSGTVLLPETINSHQFTTYWQYILTPSRLWQNIRLFISARKYNSSHCKEFCAFWIYSLLTSSSSSSRMLSFRSSSVRWLLLCKLSFNTVCSTNKESHYDCRNQFFETIKSHRIVTTPPETICARRYEFYLNHTSSLQSVFGDRIINGWLWPPRSPYLNPCKFHLCGMLKDKVYSQQASHWKTPDRQRSKYTTRNERVCYVWRLSASQRLPLAVSWRHVTQNNVHVLYTTHFSSHRRM